MKTKLITTLSLCLLVLTGFSQRAEITGVRNITKHNVRPLFDNNHAVKGYYSFYEVEKVDRKNRGYRLTLFDNALGETHRIPMVKPKTAYLGGADFNGTHFCFLFYDAKSGEQSVVIYDLEGDETGSTTYQRGKSTLVVQGATTLSVSPVPNKGFILIRQNRNKGIKTSLVFIDNEGNESWETKSMFEAEKSYESSSVIFANEKFIFASSVSARGLMAAKKQVTSFNVYNTEDGSVVGDFALTEGAYALNPYGADYDEEDDAILIYGEYYGRTKKGGLDIKNNLGLFIRKYSRDGFMMNEELVNWEKDLKPIIPFDEDEKKADKRSIMIHEIVKMADGNYYAFAEQYRKVVAAGTMAAKMLVQAAGGDTNVSNMKVNLYDMMVFSFDSELKPIDIDIIDKKKTNVHLPEGWGIIQEDKLGYLLKALGWFDYSFTVLDSNKENFNAIYINFDRKSNKGNKIKHSIGCIYKGENEKIESLTMPVTENPKWFSVMPAMTGYVAIKKYFKKEKKMIIELEKLDY